MFFKGLDLQMEKRLLPKTTKNLTLVMTCWQPLCQKQGNIFQSGENDLQWEGKQVMNISF